jgi:carbon monoxide dehydrogenase subunit G
VLIENSFEVPEPIDRVWNYLSDVEKVVPCMPGAELTETLDDRNYKGKVTVKLGPVALTFAGKVEMSERDDDTHRILLLGSGMEQRGKGAASATITTTAEERPGGTLVKVVQDLKVQGQVAQMSRGMMQDVSAKLTRQFAECLKKNLATESPATESAPPVEGAPSGGPPAGGVPSGGPVSRPVAAAKPVGGLRLAFGAIAGAISRSLARLLRRRSGPKT